jgi:hypothetical protein
LAFFRCFAKEKPLAKARFSETLEMDVERDGGGGMEKTTFARVISRVKGCNSSVFDGFLQGLPDDLFVYFLLRKFCHLKVVLYFMSCCCVLTLKHLHYK